MLADPALQPLNRLDYVSIITYINFDLYKDYINSDLSNKPRHIDLRNHLPPKEFLMFLF